MLESIRPLILLLGQFKTTKLYRISDTKDLILRPNTFQKLLWPRKEEEEAPVVEARWCCWRPSPWWSWRSSSHPSSSSSQSSPSSLFYSPSCKFWFSFRIRVCSHRWIWEKLRNIQHLSNVFASLVYFLRSIWLLLFKQYKPKVTFASWPSLSLFFRTYMMLFYTSNWKKDSKGYWISNRMEMLIEINYQL